MALGHAGTFTFNILTPKPSLFIFTPRCTNDKCLGENSSMHTKDFEKNHVQMEAHTDARTEARTGDKNIMPLGPPDSSGDTER